MLRDARLTDRTLRFVHAVPAALMLRNVGLLLSLALVAPSVATAQVLTFSTTIEGDLGDDDANAFRDALGEGLSTDARVELVDEAGTAELLGDGATCADADCAVAAGEAISASLGVRAEIYAEAEIYDFTIQIFDLNTGEEVIPAQMGDCTFCPVAEALDAFRLTAASAIDRVDEFPEPTPDPNAVAEVEPDTEPEPEPETAELIEGEIPIGISAVPEDAEIRVNGQIVGTGRANLTLAPQELEVVILADGHDEFTEAITLTEAMVGPVYLRAHLTREVQVVEAPPRRQAQNRDTAGPSFNRRAVGGVMAGVGGASLVTGIALLAIDGNTNCASGAVTACPEIYETTGGGVALTALGGLAAGTGIGLIISTLGGGDGDEAASRGRDVAVSPTRGGAVVNFGTRF